MLEQTFEPVSSRTTIQDGVYQRLRRALMTGGFEPDQTLTISSLAETFGVSQMPVREALRRLAAANALEVAANGSSCVPAVSRAKLDDLCRARIAIEGLATELAAPRIDSAAIRALRGNVAEHDALSDEKDEKNVYDMLIKNQEFHFGIYCASGSDVLMQIIETLWLRFGPYMRLLTRHMEQQLMGEGARKFTMRHRMVITALENGDAAKARDAIVEDIAATQALLWDLDFSAAATNAAVARRRSA